MLLTETDCKIILSNYLKKNDHNYIKFDLRPLSEETEGFMGEHYKLTITYQETHTDNKQKTQQFFMKTKPMNNPIQEEMTQQLYMYEKEIFTYEVLFKEFAKYGYDMSFASTSYYCLPATALVLDDLSLRDYAITERHETFSLGHVRCALHALAGFHAAGYAYQARKTGEGRATKIGEGRATKIGEGRATKIGEGRDTKTGEGQPSKDQRLPFRLTNDYGDYLKENFFVQYLDPKAYGMKWWVGSRATVLKLIHLLQGHPNFPNFENLYLNYKFGKVFSEESTINKTCGHGDLWSNNLMFKYENNQPIKCRLLDFQLCRYFFPSLDVILLIFCNTDAQFRKLHLESLYKYYFDQLAEFLSKYGHDVEEIHPWRDFLETIDMIMPDALSQVLLVYCIVNLPKEMLSNMVQGDNQGVAEIMFNNCDLVAEAFVNDAEYKKKIMEGLRDFYNVLSHVN